MSNCILKYSHYIALKNDYKINESSRIKFCLIVNSSGRAVSIHFPCPV